jgi:peptidoglycan hydrolase-like protein with peptidoglycan-binding domain
MSYIDIYNARISYNGSTDKERLINDGIDNFAEFLKYAPNKEVIKVGNIDYDCVIQDVAFNDSNKDNKILQVTLETPFNIGIVFEWGIEKWLITSIEKNVIPTHKTFKITQCTSVLSFYKPTISPTPIQIPYIVESGARSSDLGIDENKYIIQPSGEITIKVSNNDITKYIERNDIYKLSEFDNYEVIDIDRVKEVGLLIIKLKWCAEQQEAHIFTLTITNGETVDIQEGSTLQLNVQVDDNGTPISPTPDLTYTSSNPLVCTVDSSGLVTALDIIDDCVITVKLASDNTIFDTITVNVTALPQTNYSYSLSSVSLPDSEIKINQTKTYIAQKYNNGVAIAQSFTFSVAGDTTSYQLVVIDGNSCTVKALKSSGTITLKATDNSDISKVVEKLITLKNVF